MTYEEKVKMFNENIRLVYKYYNKHRSKCHANEQDDMLQELLIKYWEIICIYEPSKGLFSTLLYLSFDRLMAGKFRTEKRFKEHITLLEYDALNRTEDPDSHTLLIALEASGSVINNKPLDNDVWLDKDYVRFLIKNTKFSKQEQEFLKYYLKNYDNQDIEKYTGKSTSLITSVRYNIATKLRKTAERYASRDGIEL